MQLITRNKMTRYEKWMKEVRRARDASYGRKIANNTRLRLGNKGELIFRHHYTDIVRIYPDGSVDINTGWTTQSTVARIYEYTGFRVSNIKLPTYSGLRPSIDSLLCLVTPKNTVVFESYGYIHVDVDRVVDMDSVRAVSVLLASDPKRIIKARRKMYAVADLMESSLKLGVSERITEEDIRHKLLDSIEKPITELLPIPGVRAEIIKRNFPSIYTVGKFLGAIKEVQIKIPQFV